MLSRGTNGDGSYEAKGGWVQGEMEPCDEKFSCKMRFSQCESSEAGASVFLKKFIEELARAHTLLAVAAQHVADGVLHILRL